MHISAYIPAYNCAGTLAEAIDSIRQQTLQVDELFVIDDGSTDRSAEVAERLQVRLLRHTENQGRGSTRAHAMETARHEWVLGCDARVRLSTTFLAQAVQWFQNSRVGAVFGPIAHDSSQNITGRWRRRHLFKTHLKPRLDHQASLITGGALINRTAVLEVGNFNPSLHQHEDYDLGQRLLRSGYQVISDPTLLLTALGTDSVWKTFERYRRWNIHPPFTWSAHLRQVAYSIKVMLKQDLQHRDLAAASLSLLWPFYLLWKSGESLNPPPCSHLSESPRASD